MFTKIYPKLRTLIPLKARIAFGPSIAYWYYFFYTNFNKKQFTPTILSIEETLDLINQKKLSVIRFGDGELSLLDNTDLGFQKKDDKLIKRLATILTKDEKGLLICILNLWNKAIYQLDPHVVKFELHHFLKYHKLWEKHITSKQVYGDAFITRPYLTIGDKKRSAGIFKKMKALWEHEDVVLVEGEKSRLGLGNDLFSNTKTLERVLCPNENAFSYYETIICEVKKTPKTKLILISLGPTAKVLAYDLFKEGYRVLDIGHIDMEYDMFLRQEKKLVKVPYKYSNELNERNPDNCADEKYLNEIRVNLAQ